MASGIVAKVQDDRPPPGLQSQVTLSALDLQVAQRPPCGHGLVCSGPAPGHLGQARDFSIGEGLL